MKEITLEEAKNVLINKPYVEALAFFTDYLNQFNENDQDDELDDLDDRIFEKANYDWHCGEEWLRIYSGLMVAIGWTKKS